MASDGRLWFSTKIDNSQVAKDLKAVENKIRKSQEEISKAETKKLPLVKQSEELGVKLDEAKAKAASLKQELATLKMAQTGTDPVAAMEANARLPEAQAELKASEAEVQKLQKQWDAVNDKVDGYDQKIRTANADIARATEKAAELNSQLMTPSQLKMSDAFKKAEGAATKFNHRLGSIAKRVFVFWLITKGLREMLSYMGTALKTNDQYNAQLAQLKGAWLTAFQPIYEFVLPGLLAIMRVLTAIGNALAAVLSFFGGKTATQSAKNAQALQKQAGAIGAVGAAAKDAKKQLMGFDEINRMESTDTGTAGIGAGSDVVSPDFSGITDMEEHMTQILDLVTAIAGALLAWGIANMFTNSLSMLAGIAMTVGGAILFAFNWADAFANGIDWDNLSGMLLGLGLAVGGLALAFGAPAAAIALLIGGIALVVLALREWITTGELSNEACAALVIGIMAIGGAIALFMGPTGWIALLIAGIAAFVVAVATKGDEVKSLLGKVSEWLKNVFWRDWTEVFGTGLGTAMNAFVAVMAYILGGAKDLLVGLIDFLQLVFAGNWGAVWEKLAGITKGAVNGVISVVNSLIAAVGNAINALFDLLSFNINLPGGGSIGMRLPQVSIPQIPYLAQGAVLPANKPFLAMVGDQRNGTNVEAPLETIKQALAEVMAQYGGGNVEVVFTGDLAALGRVLAPVVSKAQRDNDRGKGR